MKSAKREASVHLVRRSSGCRPSAACLVTLCNEDAGRQRSLDNNDAVISTTFRIGMKKSVERNADADDEVKVTGHRQRPVSSFY